MSWGTEEDVDKIVRKRLSERLKIVRTKHAREVQKLQDKIEILQTRLDRALDRADRASRAEGRELERATIGTGEMGQ